MDMETELEKLADLLQSLSEIERDVIIMTYYHKRDIKAIAKHTGLTEDEANETRKRALSRMKAGYLNQPG